MPAGAVHAAIVAEHDRAHVDMRSRTEVRAVQ